MTLWDHLCCFGYGIQARLDGLWHLVRGHKLYWRKDIDLWIGGTGCIVCEECPDTENNCGLFIWSRDWRWLWWCARKLCAWRGHPELRHPRQWTGTGDSLDEANMVEVEDEWYCYRCVAEIPRPTFFVHNTQKSVAIHGKQ